MSGEKRVEEKEGRKKGGKKDKVVTFKEQERYKYEEEEREALRVPRNGFSRIDFHKEYSIWGWMSNFYIAPISVDGVEWPSSEHYFQAQKFDDEKSINDIHQARSPGEAASMGRDRKRSLRKDWDTEKEAVMTKALQAKFTQHERLGQYLRHTFPLALNEDAPRDAYWGSGSDGRGRNRLGALLRQVREELLAAEHVKAAAKGPGQQVGPQDSWSEEGHWSHLECGADKCPCCRARENRQHIVSNGGAEAGQDGGGRRFVIHVCEVCGPPTDLQVHGGDPALNEKGGAGPAGADGKRGGKESDPGADGESKGAGGAEGGPRGPSRAREGGSKGAPMGALLLRSWLAEEGQMQPQPALPSSKTDCEVAEGGLVDEHRHDPWISQKDGWGAEDPGRPRKGEAWVELPGHIQGRVKEAVENNAAVIDCEHRLVIGGVCGGRLIVPEATLEGLQGRTCCSTSLPMPAAAKERVDPPGARHPETVLNIAQMREDIEATNALGGLQFTDIGLWDSLVYGIEVGFVGERHGVIVFPASKGGTARAWSVSRQGGGQEGPPRLTQRGRKAGAQYSLPRENPRGGNGFALGTFPPTSTRAEVDSGFRRWGRAAEPGEKRTSRR